MSCCITHRADARCQTLNNNPNYFPCLSLRLIRLTATLVCRMNLQTNLHQLTSFSRLGRSFLFSYNILILTFRPEADHFFQWNISSLVLVKLFVQCARFVTFKTISEVLLFMSSFEIQRLSNLSQLEAKRSHRFTSPIPDIGIQLLWPQTAERRALNIASAKKLLQKVQIAVHLCTHNQTKVEQHTLFFITWLNLL